MQQALWLKNGTRTGGETMKPHCFSHICWATTLGAGLLSATFAQNERLELTVRHMDGALSQSERVAAGLAGQPFLEAPQRFNVSLVQSAPINNDPGLQGRIERKAAQNLDRPADASAAIVNVGSHSSFVEFTDSAGTQHFSHSFEQPIFEDARKPPQPSRADPRALMISPGDGSTLAAIQTFTWTAGRQSQDYWVRIGSCHHCADLLDQDNQLRQSLTAHLPTDGRIIFVTLFTESGGKWHWVDSQFVALNSRPQPAQMISPTTGATLSATQVFSWTPGGYVDQYFLWVGSCQDCNDILDESENHNLSRTLSLPSDGRTIYVTLFSSIGGRWYWYDYQYRAPFTQPYPTRIYVTNKLDYPIDVFLNGTAIGSVSAQNTQYADVNTSSLTLSFLVVQPTLAGKVLGDSMAGVFQTIANPSGSYSFNIGTVIGQQAYFEPLITNQTGSPVEIEVNAGLRAQNRCNCDVPAGSKHVSTGYYLLFNQSNVRLFLGGSGYTGDYWIWGTDDDGEIAPGGILSRYVDSLGRAYLTLSTPL
jgi:hypothetical protein